MPVNRASFRRNAALNCAKVRQESPECCSGTGTCSTNSYRAVTWFELHCRRPVRSCILSGRPLLSTSLHGPPRIELAFRRQRAAFVAQSYTRVDERVRERRDPLEVIFPRAAAPLFKFRCPTKIVPPWAKSRVAEVDRMNMLGLNDIGGIGFGVTARMAARRCVTFSRAASMSDHGDGIAADNKTGMACRPDWPHSSMSNRRRERTGRALAEIFAAGGGSLLAVALGLPVQRQREEKLPRMMPTKRSTPIRSRSF